MMVNAMTSRLGNIVLLPLALLAATSAAAAATLPPPPPTPAGTAHDVFYGTTVPDPYRWLEAGDDTAVRSWSAGQDKRSRAYLDSLAVRSQLHARLEHIFSSATNSLSRVTPAGGSVFALQNSPPRQQPLLVMMDRTLDPAHARVVLDTNTLNGGGSTAIDRFVPAPDGSKIAVSLSANGSEDGTLHLIDVTTGKDCDTPIPRVQFPTAGGALAWQHDGTGFWYTRFPGPDAPAERQHFYQQVYYHRLGSDPARDKYVIGKDFPKIAEIFLDNQQSKSATLISVANGDGGEFAHYVIDGAGAIHQVSHFTDHIVAGVIGPDERLYLVSRDKAPRGKLIVLAAGDYDLAHAKILIPQDDGVIEGGGEFGGVPVTFTQHALYLRELVGGPSRIMAYDRNGRKLPAPTMPAIADVEELAAADDHSIVYSVATYLKPRFYARYDERRGHAESTAITDRSPVSFDDARVMRVFATSRDGTRIPLVIIAPKGAKLTGRNPTLLYGYGGYGVSQVPYFLGARGRLWLDGGGVFALANLRGGGEFGEAWHKAGALTKKQNVFDDYFACAQYLIAQRWTSPAHLAALGASNGGLLMGAQITQHPSTYHAVAALVGLYDMIRVERDPNGAFNTTEFGSVDNPEQFHALYAYSPYHHVRPGTAYPAVFMATGTNDGRVNPMHSRKMVAALQAASSSSLPVLLSINDHAGHGIGSALSVRIDQMADVLGFFYDQLGMTLPPTASP